LRKITTSWATAADWPLSNFENEKKREKNQHGKSALSGGEKVKPPSASKENKGDGGVPEERQKQN